MKNKIINSFFKSDKREDTLEDENITNLLFHLFSSMTLGIQLFN